MKLKDHIEERETNAEARIRYLKTQSLVEYYIESMTLREALTTLEDILYKQYDNMPNEVLTKEYDKVFNRGEN
jgi:hypothetical protein